MQYKLYTNPFFFFLVSPQRHTYISINKAIAVKTTHTHTHTRHGWSGACARVCSLLPLPQLICALTQVIHFNQINWTNRNQQCLCTESAKRLIYCSLARNNNGHACHPESHKDENERPQCGETGHSERTKRGRSMHNLRYMYNIQTHYSHTRSIFADRMCVYARTSHTTFSPVEIVTSYSVHRCNQTIRVHTSLHFYALAALSNGGGSEWHKCPAPLVFINFDFYVFFCGCCYRCFRLWGGQLSYCIWHSAASQ